jgi:hypothetical protein
MRYLRPNIIWHLFLAILTCLPLGSAIADSPPAAEAQRTDPGSSKWLTSLEATADFDLLRELLEEAHPGLYRYATKTEMDLTFETQRAKLNHPITKEEFMRVVAETLAVIRCGHTSCDPDEEMQKAWANARLFPLRMIPEGDRLMVLLNDTADDQSIRPGMEVLEINGHKAADILDRIWRRESADGDILTGKSMHIRSRFGQLFYWLFEQTNVFDVKAKDMTGRIVSSRREGVTNAEREKNRNPENAVVLQNIAKLNWSSNNASVRFLKDPDIAEIRLRYFVGGDFPQWIEDTFKS